MSPKVWEASGHLEVFTDPLVECLNCHQRFRADHLPGVHAPQSGHEEDETTLDMHARPKCPNCGHQDVHRPAELQPDVQDPHGAGRRRVERGLPAPGDGAGACSSTSRRCSRRAARRCRSGSPRSASRSATRSRRATSSSGCASSSRWRWSSSSSPGPTRSGTSTGSTSGSAGTRTSGSAPENLRLREHDADELSHYAKRTVDVEYRFPFTDWGELEGIANRTDFDLKQHEKASGQDLTYFDQEKDERYHPFVIEPSAGVDRVDPRVPDRRLPGGGGADRQGRHREADVSRAPPGPRAGQGRGAPAQPERAAHPRRAGGVRPGEGPLDVRLRRRGLDRPPVPAPGRGRDALLRDGRLRHARGPAGHRPRARLDGPGAPARSRTSSRTWTNDCRNPVDEPRPQRGWPILYFVAFGLMLTAGVLIASAGLGHLRSTGLLRVSALVSGAAIVLAVLSVVVPRRR